MNDQYESLPAPLKARAVCLSGSSDSGSKAKHAAFVRDLLADKLSLIFLSPEKALGAGMQALLAMPRVRARLALVCVDEAHCISEWSHHFRPSYLRLAEVFRHAQCVLCVTATASRRVVHDVLHQLRSRQVEAKTSEDESDMVLQMPWQRRNLALEVRSVRSNDERLRHLVQALPELSKGPKGSGGGVIVALDTQREEDKEVVLVTLRPLSMSRCTLQLLDTQAKKLAPRSCVKLLLEAVRRKELPSARVTHRKDGYLSSWTIDLHLHETAHWYSRAVSSKGNGEEVSALLAHSSAQQEGETTAAAVAAASNERRMLQELRAAQQTGQIQRMTLSQPAFQVQLSWQMEVTEEIKAEAVDRWTAVLYAKHEHLESRQLKRLVQLYDALNAAALPAPAPSNHEEEEDLDEKALALETKLVHYFEDDVDEKDKSEEDQLLKVLRPLTASLIESIERDTRSLVLLRLGGEGPKEESEESKSNAEDAKWTSYAVAKVFHGLTTPQLPTRQWRDHVCWRRYSDVAFERIVHIANKVLQEDQEDTKGN
ncbi:hypothetical protein DVH05_004687 [Phytophthora capsici]|nr:hypothetical protein DVH05_004687 [Phytophthora capsici]